MSLRRSARISTRSVSTAEVSTPQGTATVPSVKGATRARPSTKAKIATTTNNKRKAEIISAEASDVAPAASANKLPLDNAGADPEELPEPDKKIAPSTPSNKRHKNGTSKPAVPNTPTPAGVKLFASSPSYRNHPLEDFPGLKPRPAEPHATNAPLVTPRGSRVVAYASSPLKPAAISAEDAPTESPAKKKKAKLVVPPDVGEKLPHPRSTVDTLLKDACEHLLKVDPRLKTLIEKHHCKIFSPEGLREVVDPFTALASGIIGQQVSGQAAASIRRKFTALFEDTHPAFPSPAQVIQKDLATLRTAGLSQRKAEYIHGLAQNFATGELSAQMLVSATDKELIDKLVAVRGLGRWSVEMFACFGLKRMDVFSTGDLGVQRGMATYMGRDVAKLKAKGGKWKYMSEKEMLDIASNFSPYRSLFMWYMWRIENIDLSVLQDN